MLHYCKFMKFGSYMFKKTFLVIFSLLLLAPIQAAHAKKLNVITSIKPVHSLVTGVMGKSGEATLLLKGGLSPHIFRMRPSHIRALYEADVIFYVDPKLEEFLASALKKKNKHLKDIALARQDGIKLQPYRKQKVWIRNTDAHDHDHETDMDLHIWLDPANARKMVEIIEETLSRLDPDNSFTYIQNANRMISRLYDLEEKIREELRPLRDKPMIVYHDAFQYFEKAFSLRSVGAILLKSDNTPSVKHLKKLKKLAKSKNITCVLGSPGSHPRIATVVMSGTEAGYETIDPLGLYHDLGPDLYFNIMNEMAENIVDCQNNDNNFKLNLK